MLAFNSDVVGARAADLTSSLRVGIEPPSFPMVEEGARAGWRIWLIKGARFSAWCDAPV